MKILKVTEIMRKKTAKLGFKSLYAYFENKIMKEKESFEEEERIRKIKSSDETTKKNKKSCSCC